MDIKGIRIDLVKLIVFYLKRIWIIIACAVIGFAALYCRTKYFQPDTYTSRGTMYVYNGNPNAVNYQYTNSSDLNSAVQLIDTYMVVIKSNKVMDVIVDRLRGDYPWITPGIVAGALSAGSVSETGVVEVRCTTPDPQLSADIVNAVLDVAPDEIIRVVSAGSIEIIDYASVPVVPDSRGAGRRGMTGALAGIVLAGAVLLVFFLMDRRISDTKELTDNYTPPVLASIKREKVDEKKEKKAQADFLLTDKSPMEKVEGYAKLRMNMLYTLVGKDHHTVVVTSAISGEGKTTISANLGVSCAMGGKKVLLIDGDMRRACLRDIFLYDKKKAGLSDILVGNAKWQDTILSTDISDHLFILPAGTIPPNPAELLSSGEMVSLLQTLEGEFELILIDMPPVNIVSDPLVLSLHAAGCLFVVRQDYTDHRDLRKALISAEMTGMNVLGFVFYAENVTQGSYYGYYGRRHYGRYYNYNNYYNQYDTRRSVSGALENAGASNAAAPAAGTENTAQKTAARNTTETENTVQKTAVRSTTETENTIPNTAARSTAGTENTVQNTAARSITDTENK